MQVAQTRHHQIGAVIDDLVLGIRRRKGVDGTDVGDALAFDHQCLRVARDALRSREQPAAQKDRPHLEKLFLVIRSTAARTSAVRSDMTL